MISKAFAGSIVVALAIATASGAAVAADDALDWCRIVCRIRPAHWFRHRTQGVKE